MKLSQWINGWILVGALATSAPAISQEFNERFETTSVSSEFRLNQGGMQTVQLHGGWRHVKKIIVSAQGASYSASTFQVVANGDVKGTIYVPGYDLSYIVTIEETVNSIQFQHVSGGDARILDVKVVQSERSLGGSDDFYMDDNGMSLSARNQAMSLARRAIQIVNALERHTTYRDFGTYLLPVKTSAARLYAKASARGDLSGRVRKSLVAMKQQIEFSRDYIEEAFTKDDTFQLAIELLALEEKMDAVLE